MAQMKACSQVLERSVKVDKFCLAEGKIYDKTKVVLATETGINATNYAQTMTMSFMYTDTTSSTWKRSIIAPSALKTTFTSGIAMIVEGNKIVITPEATYQTEWGKPLTTTETISASYTVTVPPRSKVTVSLLANRGHCDVPFSYTQTEKLSDGKNITVHGCHGVFTGVNSYGFLYETKEEPLPPAQCHA